MCVPLPPPLLYSCCKFSFFYICYFRSKGSSLSFITREDWKQAQNLIDILEEANQVNWQDFLMKLFGIVMNINILTLALYYFLAENM